MSKHAVEAFGVSAVWRMGTIESPVADRSRHKEPDMVIPDRREAEIRIRKATQELVQLNEGLPCTDSRDALLDLLDEALKTARPATPAAPADGTVSGG